MAEFAPNQLLDLVPGVGQRQESIVYRLTDDQGNATGDVHPERAQASVSFDTSANVTRTLSNLIFTAAEFADIDPYADRIEPTWVLEDGSEWQLGRYYFTGVPQEQGLVRCTTMFDVLGMVADTGSLQAFGVDAGGRVHDKMVEVLNILGIRDYEVDVTDVTVSSPIAWNLGTSWLTILRYLTDMAGFIPPHTTNSGSVRLRRVDDIRIDSAVVRYAAGGNLVVNDTTSVNPNLVDAANAHLVVDTGATDAPITAFAFVDPALPWSKENRGFVKSETHEVQGIESTEQAQQMADNYASVDANGFEEITFTTAPDPRHDSFMIIGYNGIAYREVGWNLPLQVGAQHAHRVVRSGVTGRA